MWRVALVFLPTWDPDGGFERLEGCGSERGMFDNRGCASGSMSVSSRNGSRVGSAASPRCSVPSSPSAPTSWRSRRVRGARGPALGDAVEFHSLGPGAPRWRYELWNRYRRHRIDLDVDVCHAPSLAVPPVNVPLVVTINDVAFLRHPEAFTPHGIRFHERGLAIARREAAAIIVPSAFTGEELEREGFDRARIHCVPLAVSAPGSSVGGDVQSAAARGVRGPYLLTAGTVEPRKDLATVVQAFERVRARWPELSLVVAGPRGWLSARAASELERPGIVMVGRVSDAELDALYRRAEMVVCASRLRGLRPHGARGTRAGPAGRGFGHRCARGARRRCGAVVPGRQRAPRWPLRSKRC